MNAQEKRIAHEIMTSRRKAIRGNPAGFADLKTIEHIHVKLHADGTYDYVSGPELHHVGAARRKRKVWAIRYGCDPKDGGIAKGGFSWTLTKDEAIARIR